MEDSYIIQGGKSLQGKIELSGAKNIALKVLIAATLFNEEVTLQHIPKINDVLEVCNLINDLGGRAEFVGQNTVKVDSTGMSKNKVNLLFGSKIRTSFMFFAPLLYRFKEAYIPNPGGCRLGARSIDRIVDGLKALGIHVTYDSDSGYYHSSMDSLPTGTFEFSKPSHTGTELLILMSVLAEGNKIILKNVALEPEIDDLIEFLNQAGAKIRRESNAIVIEGIKELHQTVPYVIASDRIEAATYAVLALATKGDVTVGPIQENYFKTFLTVLEKAGAGVEKIDDNYWRFFYKGPLAAVDIETLPHPGFMTDWQPIYAVLMTQAQGETTIHERIYENRFSYVDELKKLGADIEFITPQIDNPQEYYHFNYDPQKTYQQAIKISGPKPLHNGVLRIADLRAGATLAIAALVADGESVVNEISHLERGYENFVEKVTSLGGNVKKV